MGLAPDRATKAVRAKRATGRLRLLQAVGPRYGSPQPADGPRAGRGQPRPANGRRRRHHGGTRGEAGRGIHRRSALGATLRCIPAVAGATGPHPEDRRTREVSSPGNSYRKGQGGSGSIEEHPGAGVRGGLLPRLLRLPTGHVGPRSAGASSDAAATQGLQRGSGATASIPVGRGGRHQGMLRCARPSPALPAGAIPASARSRATPPRIEPWAHGGNDMS